MTIYELADRSKIASRAIALLSTEDKNRGLSAIADALLSRQSDILSANEEDMARGRENGMSDGLLDRLQLTPARIEAIADGVRQVMDLPDPIGCELSQITRPNGMTITKKTVPLGVIGIIYEARPNVTVDSGALCFKSGNATILRGGKEAFSSNKMLATVMQDALSSVHLPSDAILLVEDTSRETAKIMMTLRGKIDVLIPRGGAGLIRSIVENASVPVIETGTGNCHIYIDKDADLQKAVALLYNGKCSRPSVCNALESVLVHRDVASVFLPMAKAKLDEKSVKWLGCPSAMDILPDVTLATDADYGTEFGNFTISCKVVDTAEDAIAHIQTYTTYHSECIVTENVTTARQFTDAIDAAAVYVNVSTRFTDGCEFGLGAEIGISTQKLHARGPMGLEELTSYQYVIHGDGQVR